MKPLPVPANLDIHGIRLLNLAMEEALFALEAALSSKKQTCVSFVNADCVNIASVNTEYRAHLTRMDWVFIDGIGMRIAGRIMQQPVRDNVNGTDLFPRLCSLLAEQKRSLYLLGARPNIATAVAQWASAHYPGLRIVGTQHGYFAPEENERVLKKIRDSQPDVLLVAFGAPRQEAWINQNMAGTGATILMGVGGLFDYYSGSIPRAPLWMRKLGLEWVFRLSQEPQRLWQRYLVGNVVFLGRIAVDWLYDAVRKSRNVGSVK